MKQTDYPAGILWRASLIPDAHGKHLRLEMVDTTSLHEYEMRELCANKLGSIQDYKDERAHNGSPIHCYVDQHGMQNKLGVIILRGDLRDLEDLAHRFDNQPKQVREPSSIKTAHTKQHPNHHSLSHVSIRGPHTEQQLRRRNHLSLVGGTDLLSQNAR